MTDEELIAHDLQGMIPGPCEDEEAFCKRVKAQKKAFHEQEEKVSDALWGWPKERLQSLFGFSPQWVSASFSSKGLLPWEAAATWVDDKHIYAIRLKKGSLVSRLVDPCEVLAHEATHAARARFSESRFEEVFAYLTSKSRWRALVGPLFRNSTEGLCLVLLVALGSLSNCFESTLFILFYCVAALVVLYLSFRLLQSRRFLEKAAKNIEPFLQDPKKVKAFLFRLSDEEILSLAQGKKFLPKQGIRLRLFYLAYLNSSALFGR